MVAAAVALLLALDPVGLARVWPKRLELSVVVAVALGAAALLADPALDLVDLSPEGFWIAAGIVLLVPAFARLGRGATRDVAGPASVLVAMSVATRDGSGEALVAVAACAVATLLAMTIVTEGRAAAVTERIIGAAMVVVALDLVRDGVIAV